MKARPPVFRQFRGHPEGGGERPPALNCVAWRPDVACTGCRAGLSPRGQSGRPMEDAMPKYLFEARYSSEGAKGVAREGGSGRRDAVKKHLEEVGGKLESMYFAFGDVDCIMIADLPDNV